MMKHAFLLLAFAALAVSLPSDVPETFVEVATAESILPPVADVMDVVSPKVLPSPSPVLFKRYPSTSLPVASISRFNIFSHAGEPGSGHRS